jgi:Ca2+-binding RTX toxin-like protein
MRFRKGERMASPGRNRVYLESLEPRLLLSDMNNVAPILTVDNPLVAVNEGQMATNRGTLLDVDPVSITASIGDIQLQNNTTWAWSFDTTDGSDQTQTVTITATDNQGASSMATFDLTVNNVDPTARIVSPGVTGISEAYVLTTSSDGFIFYTPIENNGFGTTTQIGDIGSYCYGAGIGDFDNDNLLEALVGDGSGGNTWYYDKTGSGDNFEPAVSIDSTWHNYRMDFAEADFNGDGNLDALMTNYTLDYFTLYLGNGDGTFTRTTISGQRGITGLDAADFNNDGNMDFVAASNGGAYIYLGNGYGTFKTPIKLSYGQSWGVSAGDFNNDGNADLVFGKPAMFYPGNGDGTFSTGVALGFNPYSMAETDINMDGNLDLLYTDLNSLSYRLGNGDGTFGTATTVFTGNSLYGVAAPQTSPLSKVQFNEGEVVQFTATSQDPGLLDTLTFWWDWGDSTSDSIVMPGGSTLNRTVNTSHAFGGGGQYNVSLTVTDDNGGISNIATVSIEILNVAPKVEAGEGQTVNEGQVVNLVGSFTDPGQNLGETYTVGWEVFDSNNNLVASSTSPDLEFIPGDNGIYTATFTVTEDEGDPVSDSALITVNNVAPEFVEIGAPVIDENEVAVLSGTFSDGGRLDTHTLMVSWGDDTTSEAIVDPVSRTFTATHQYLDDDPTGTPSDLYKVGLILTDDEGGSVSADTIVTVSNVAPVITSLTNSAPNIGDAQEGQSISISGVFTDIGTLDTHTATIDWGDGSSSEAVINESNGSGSFSGNHEYINGGIYEITLAVNDDDGGCATQATTALITGVGINNGVLQIVGTAGRDNVEVTKGKRSGSIEVKANFLSNKSHTLTFSASDFESIVIMTGAGNDHVSVDKKITKLVTIDGGSGNDYLIAGGGPATLLGGDGHDKLIGSRVDDKIYGGDGNDVILGSGGTDLLEGGSENDIIYGSWGNDTILGGDGNDVLYGGGGNDMLDGGNGTDKLYGGSGNDHLIGGTGNDWIFGESGNDLINGGTGDDRLFGSWGNDEIWGGDGNDLLVGGLGKDTLDGGAGRDRLIDWSGKYKYFQASRKGAFHCTQVSPCAPWVKGFVSDLAIKDNTHNHNLNSCIQVVLPLAKGNTPRGRF